MKTNLFLISFFILIANSIFASSEQPLKIVSSPQVDPWVKEVGLNNFMPIIARVYKNGILYQPTGSLLGVFKDNKCWGYGGLGNSPLGTNSVYNITMKYNSTPVPGFTYKVYNPTSGKIYDLVETVTFTHQTPVGEIAAPISLNVQFAITATSADLNKGTFSGSVGTFTSGQSVNVIATPATGYRFVNWTDGVGGTVMSTNANYTFSANESRNLIANFEFTPISSTISVSEITDAANADVVVASDGKISVDGSTPITLKSLALNGGGKLELPVDKSLDITGNFMLKSGSRFIDLNLSGGLIVHGTTTIQQDLTGAGGATPNGRFWYVGTPVSGATSAVFDAAGANRLWYYNEPTHAYVEITNNTTALQTGRGYLVRLGANATVSFTGSLISGAHQFNLTNTPGDSYSGYNLIYNPYPSFIRWHDATSLEADGVSTSIWTRSATVGGSMAFDSYNVKLGSGVSGSGTGVTRYIAPYQAFWVKIAADVQLSIANSMRTLTDVEAPTNGLRAKAVSSAQLLRLKVSDGIEGDETLIAFHPSATNSVDGYDTPKMSNGDTYKIPEIFTTIATEKFAINSYNNANSLNLGFATTTDVVKNFTIKATEISNFSSDLDIVLVDNNSPSTEIKLTEGTEYSFSSGATNSSSRFTVEFRVKGSTTAVEAASKNLTYTLVRNSNNVYELNILNNKTANVKVFNTVGQLMQNFDNVSVKSIGGNLSAGVYTVVVKIDGMQSISKKLSIR